MRRSNTAIAFSDRVEHSLLWPDDEEDVDGSAATAARLAPPQSAYRLSDSTGPATQSPTSAPPKAAMALPQSNRRSDPSRVVLPSDINGVVSVARLAETPRHIDTRSRPSIRSAAHVPPTAPRHAPHMSVVDHPSGIADPPSPTVDAPAQDRYDPYHLLRAHQRAAPAESNIDDEADYIEEWRSYRVNLLQDKRWWEWDHGIIDVRALFSTRSTLAGTQLNKAFEACEWVLRRHACEFKVGMARTLGSRWELYRSSSATWTPSHLFIVLHVRGRDAVGFAEAGLIGMLYACGDYDDDLNINHRNNDRGGSGPRHECELDDWFWVYLAVRNLS
jgi:hypothetical protein